MVTYHNVGKHPIDELNKECRKLLMKNPSTDAVLLVIINNGAVDLAVAARSKFTPALVVSTLRTMADQIARDAKQ